MNRAGCGGHASGCSTPRDNSHEIHTSISNLHLLYHGKRLWAPSRAEWVKRMPFPVSESYTRRDDPVHGGPIAAVLDSGQSVESFYDPSRPHLVRAVYHGQSLPNRTPTSRSHSLPTICLHHQPRPPRAIPRGTWPGRRRLVTGLSPAQRQLEALDRADVARSSRARAVLDQPPATREALCCPYWACDMPSAAGRSLAASMPATGSLAAA